MGIISKLRNMFSSTPAPAGAATTAKERSNLADLADELEEMRGDAVPAGNDPVHRPQDDKIAAIVASANATKNAELSTGGKVVETMTDHGVK